MARWQPNPRERLTRAALDLFTERGYDNTTVIDIAQRAGLGKTTFFRHFQDKREVLFGGGTVADLLAASVAEAPPTATPLEAVDRALSALGREVFTAERHDFVSRRQAVIDAHPELQEREALKGLALTDAMATALRARGVPDLTARTAAELGSLASKIAFDHWSRTGNDPDAASFADLAHEALLRLRDAARTVDRVETEGPAPR